MNDIKVYYLDFDFNHKKLVPYYQSFIIVSEKYVINSCHTFWVDDIKRKGNKKKSGLAIIFRNFLASEISNICLRSECENLMELEEKCSCFNISKRCLSKWLKAVTQSFPPWSFLQRKELLVEALNCGAT